MKLTQPRGFALVSFVFEFVSVFEFVFVKRYEEIDNSTDLFLAWVFPHFPQQLPEPPLYCSQLTVDISCIIDISCIMIHINN